jgi:protocatechuate 3,4-dioxygenase, beta subunit
VIDSPHPPLLHPEYRSTVTRAPQRSFLSFPLTLTELSGPLLGDGRVGEHDHDLTRGGPGEPIGERIIVHGRVVEGDNHPVADTLVEVWQANSAGRYAHGRDRHPAPLDPNFTGVGRCITNTKGEFRFTTVRPGAYPWKNHDNAWRPAHIHFSVFGRAFIQRLITQMYFPADPLLDLDPVFNSVPDPRARARLIARFDLSATEPEWALAYRFDIVLCGRASTPLEHEEQDR